MLFCLCQVTSCKDTRHLNRTWHMCAHNQTYIMLRRVIYIMHARRKQDDEWGEVKNYNLSASNASRQYNSSEALTNNARWDLIALMLENAMFFTDQLFVLESYSEVHYLEDILMLRYNHYKIYKQSVMIWLLNALLSELNN